MRTKKRLIVVTLLSVLAFAVVASGRGAALLRDWWIHPRGESYDPAVHYKAPDGELYFHAENDLGRGLEAIVVHGGSEPRVTAELGADLWAYVARHGGSLVPVILYDSNADGRVDRTLRGRLDDRTAVFSDARVADVDWRGRHWQMGIRYEAGPTGLAADDRRYLASVAGETARVRFPRVDDLPAVSAANNAVINPLLQVTLGVASSPEAADDAGHVTGAVTQAWAQNLPGSERSMDALNPLSLWYHDRAFKPTAYTRTDTQLNIDRLLSIANMFGVYGLTTLGGGSGGGAGGGGGGSPPPGVTPGPPSAPPVVMPGC